MENRVDVAISVYGKPFQTAVALATLIEHSGKHIGTIFFQRELGQPHAAEIPAVIDAFPEANFTCYEPTQYLGWDGHDRKRLSEVDYRRSIRYQVAWEDSSQNFLFVAHNDCVFTGDILGGMLSELTRTGSTGVGLIGQCWNCPASMQGLCNGDIFPAYDPSIDEVAVLLSHYPDIRTKLHMIDPERPMPLPECRLNEFACLIDLRACRAEVLPIGNIVPFGFMTLDIGVEWFQQLVHRGHKFLNWRRDFDHAPFSPHRNGHVADLNRSIYEQSEEEAAKFLQHHFPETAARLTSRLNQIRE